MIEVQGLCRRFGSTLAVNDISFEVPRGQVVGLLGPNGAGKTTTMRMICGCIGATSGQVRIDGQPVSQASKETKSRIGYLPESPPLYRSMAVRDYIAFAAQIQGVQAIRPAVEQVIEQVGLGDVQHRIIGHLSKGFRQRVGLAQALVHQPELLILDEPSSGLDPAQRVEIRQLLLSLAAGERTVLLSTHILSDVEAICERVLIIHRGRMVADQPLMGNPNHHRCLEIVLARPSDRATAILESLEGVVSVQEVESDLTRFRVVIDVDIREAIVLNLAPLGLIEIRSDQNLEQSYLMHTEAVPA